ncbi:7460_t:CDS:2 [Racocetra fulgida]|uniref:7460_t:CDS:1 n=1 Tax=Racocetra fulgida TaxID=60492 RepID=A0A9N9E812_9GLOM|nr:7460_t:CDS:2 [Racocetra fulgida]
MNEEKSIYPASYLDRLNNLITNHFNHLCPIKKDFHLTLSGISRLVMLDRYSQKDKERKTLQIGDIVLTVIKPDPKFPSRVARTMANQEKEEKLREKYFHAFYEQIKNFKIVPAGRILHGSGSQNKVTYFNCYVMPYIPDSRKGIARHREEVMEIMSRGGGVGSNGSTLRPKGALVQSVGVEQGGSRRGAQMIMLAD